MSPRVPGDYQGAIGFDDSEQDDEAVIVEYEGGGAGDDGHGSHYHDDGDDGDNDSDVVGVATIGKRHHPLELEENFNDEEPDGIIIDDDDAHANHHQPQGS